MGVRSAVRLTDDELPTMDYAAKSGSIGGRGQQ
jgi:hypothetical protein